MTILSSRSMAQDYKADLGRISSSIEQATGCHIVSQITMYESSKNLKKVHSFSAELKRSDDAYHSIIDEVEMISNDQMLVVVDREEKIIQVQKTPKLSRSDQNFLEDFYALDSIADLDAKVACVNNNESQVVYELTFLSGMIKSVKVTIDKASFTLKKLEYQYNDKYYPTGNYVVIEYQKFDLEPGFSKSEFSASEFVERRGNSFVLGTAYQSWELLNLYDIEIHEN